MSHKDDKNYPHEGWYENWKWWSGLDANQRRQYIAKAREMGAKWREIAESCGVSVNSVWKQSV